MDIESFINATNAVEDMALLHGLIVQATALYGYEKLVLFSPSGPHPDDVSCYDNATIALYRSQRLHRIDPLLHLFLTHPRPFHDTQIPADSLTAPQRATLAFHRAHGMVSGLGFPLGSISDKRVGAMLFSDRETPQPGEKTAHRLYALVHQYILRYAQICRQLPLQQHQLAHHLSG